MEREVAKNEALDDLNDYLMSLTVEEVELFIAGLKAYQEDLMRERHIEMGYIRWE